MKILVATSKSQGTRDNDFCWTVDGELVVFPPIECDCGGIDGACGCRRSMAGLTSHRATTTVEVAERPELSQALYGDLIEDGLRDQGYLTDELLEDPEVCEWLRETIVELIVIGEVFPVGTVLERRGDILSVRDGAQAA